MSTTKQEKMSWATVGNMAHAASLCNVMVFAFCVAFERLMFDSYWKQWGFCIANPDVPYWSSHDLCLYADLFLGGLLGVLYWLLHKQSGMEPANELVALSALGVVGHGIGHGALAAHMRKGTQDMLEDGQKINYETFNADTATEIVVQQAPFLVFWIALLKSAAPKATWPTVVGMSLASLSLGLMIPANLGFTYVQSVLFLAFDVNEMLKPKEEKGFEYAMYPLMVGIPTALVGWIESTMCTKGVINIGGHLIYDAYIPLSMLAFYLMCYARTRVPATAPKTKVA